MSGSRRTSGIGCAVFVLFIGFIFGSPGTDKASAGAQNSQGDKTVEQVRKNIQVLKGLPDSQLLKVMHLMRASLGVRCDYCHIAENDKYWMDDKPAKQIARQHIQMTNEINKASFAGRPTVTCNTCHQGRAQPVSIPSTEQGVFANTTREDPEAARPAPLPGAGEVMAKYIQALGGQAARDKVKTRVTKMSMLRPKLVNSGTPKAAMINRGEAWEMEIYQKAPDKYLTIITTPDGTVYQGFNGGTGWIRSPEEQREMSAPELARIKQQADINRDIKLEEQYSTLKVTGREKLGGRDVYVVEGLSRNNRNEKLFFDIQTGLLTRRIVLTETRLGFDPEQIDYEDYREVDGIRIPFTIRTSYLDDNHFGTTRTIKEVRHNVPVDDSKFDPPAGKK
ncbi:MAG TPA: c-type cytochrome [Blastocatellia bacterium]|jgi:hypothetical protein|nr:c-type cytochrome [Blastocatellia bacterium]